MRYIPFLGFILLLIYLRLYIVHLAFLLDVT